MTTINNQPKILTQYAELISIMQQDANSHHIESWISFNRLFIQSDVNELMIRNNLNQTGTLTIARIELNHRHNGTGTNIITWLEKFAHTHNGKRLVIECVLSQPMRNLALKLSFHEDPHIPDNYIKSL